MKNFKNWLGDIITMLLLMALLVIMFMTACSTRHKVEELKKEIIANRDAILGGIAQMNQTTQDDVTLAA